MSDPLLVLLGTSPKEVSSKSIHICIYSYVYVYIDVFVFVCMACEEDIL